ncbi:MAG: hypothetical protein RLN85_16430 [Pseudomonadales bacterium]
MSERKLSEEEQNILDSFESGDYQSVLTEGRKEELEAISKKLVQAEQGGFTNQSPEDILREIKNGFGQDFESSK